jgi:hypothetical protein
MSKTFSDEERDAILAESYAALDRTAEIAAVAKMPNENESPTRISEPPTETRNQRHIREIEEQEARFERERAEERRREMRERRAQLSHQRIDGLEEQVLEVVRCMITACEGLENELARVTRENLELKTKQLNLEAALAELRLSLATDDRKAIRDLPNPLTRVN